MFFRDLKNESGMSIVSTLIAASILVGAIAAVIIPAMHLHRAMKKSEIANMAVLMEANLISAFHNKINFPDPTDPSSPNVSLRAGTLPADFKLLTSFKELHLVPDSSGAESSVTGFLTKDLVDCPAFSGVCVLRYQIRLKNLTSSNPPAFAFSYQIDANPDVMQMAPLGNATSFSSPIDPGLYRAEYLKNICDSSSDIFMTGMNRDTGEAFCTEKPLLSKCPDGHLPKGIDFEVYTGSPKAGAVKMKCDPNPMRTINCPTNYALERFKPVYADPLAAVAPGECVFRTRPVAAMPNTIPAASSPPLRSVSATVCPPFYNAGNSSACQLRANSSRNSAPEGMGRCAGTAYKDCSRTTTTTTNDGGAAYASWAACMALVPAPPGGCVAMPANPVVSTTCTSVQYSRYCNGAVTSGGAYCPGGTDTGWSTGTAYATGPYDVAPTASTSATFSGRRMGCSFTDTSTPCGAPDLDVNGNPWGKKTAKWFGGVQISGASCTFDPGTFGPERVPAN